MTRSRVYKGHQIAAGPQGWVVTDPKGRRIKGRFDTLSAAKFHISYLARRSAAGA